MGYSFCDNINDDIILGLIDKKNVDAEVRAINKSIVGNLDAKSYKHININGEKYVNFHK